MHRLAHTLCIPYIQNLFHTNWLVTGACLIFKCPCIQIFLCKLTHILCIPHAFKITSAQHTELLYMSSNVHTFKISSSQTTNILHISHIFNWTFLQNLFYPIWPIASVYFMYSNAHTFKITYIYIYISPIIKGSYIQTLSYTNWLIPCAFSTFILF